tara:strand:- start:457 stop:1296 length:840 start_codon:yes stop_codon:yes gene_type:complete
MKVIDCFLFFNEIELLKLRLKELSDVVDHFVLVEAKRSFSNRKKQLFFEDGKDEFSQYSSKITHLITPDPPGNWIWRSKRRSAWKRQEFQRNYLSNGIRKLKPEKQDLILLSDVDEIFDSNTLSELKENSFSGIANFEQDLYYYDHTCRHHEKWTLPLVSSFDTLGPRINSLHRLRIERSTMKEIQIIKKGGWHFSYFGGVDAILNKLRNLSAHTEINTPEISNPNSIRKLVKERKDILLRGKSESFEYVDPEKNNYLPRHIDFLFSKNLPSGTSEKEN